VGRIAALDVISKLAELDRATEGARWRCKQPGGAAAGQSKDAQVTVGRSMEKWATDGLQVSAIAAGDQIGQVAR